MFSDDFLPILNHNHIDHHRNRQLSLLIGRPHFFGQTARPIKKKTKTVHVLYVRSRVSFFPRQNVDGHILRRLTDHFQSF